MAAVGSRTPLTAAIAAVGRGWSSTALAFAVLSVTSGLDLWADVYSVPPSGRESTVAVVRSDLGDLPQPASPETPLSYPQIRDLVRRAVDMGGLLDVLRQAEQERGDTIGVVIKVNIVHTTPNPGDITDWRVVKGLIEAVHALVPAARVTIAEAGSWVPPERTDVIELLPWVEVADGFARAGYRQLLDDGDLTGVRLDIVDLNFDELDEVPVPGGGLASASFHLPQTILQADVLIDVPVLKITGTVGMTVAMKNLVGIIPGMVYGWPKSSGFPPDGDNRGIPHSDQTLDETIADLTAAAGVDFALVDAIVGMAKARIEDDGGHAVRLNALVAGADLVAVDAVCARLMGMNPADMEFITLAHRSGIGVGRLDEIRLVGQPLDEVGRRFEKHPREWSESGHYGQGNRLWILKGPIPPDDEESGLTVDPGRLQPMAGQDGWSAPVYFHDDRIDLDRYFGDPAHCSVYAYAELESPASRDAHLWVGSDEGLQIWLNGEQVYSFEGSRRHHLPTARVPVTIQQGRNTCLVRTSQRRGRFEFSFKVCEPESDARYDGNALSNLRYLVPAPDGAVPKEQLSSSAGSDRAPWWAEHSVDITRSRRVELRAYLPANGQATWIGLDHPLAWGWPMELEAIRNPDGLEIATSNVGSFHLAARGPLDDLGTPLAVRVDGHAVGTLHLVSGERVALEAGVSDTSVVGWRVLADAAAVDDDMTVAVAPDSLSRSERPPGQWDTPMGNWFTDAVRWATRADVVFQNNGGIRTDLAAGPIAISHLFELNFPDEIYTFQVSGEELLAILEHDVRDGKDGPPMQVSGLWYVFDRRRPEGDRVVSSTLDRSRTYTVASEDYVCLRGERFFGREVEFVKTGIHVVDAHIRYARHLGQVVAQSEGRIREVGTSE